MFHRLVIRLRVTVAVATAQANAADEVDYLAQLRIALDENARLRALVADLTPPF